MLIGISSLDASPTPAATAAAAAVAMRCGTACADGRGHCEAALQEMLEFISEAAESSSATASQPNSARASLSTLFAGGAARPASLLRSLCDLPCTVWHL
jgi:hypothetical protein